MVKPNSEEFTFYRPNCAASCLDRFYVPQFLVPQVKHVSHNASLVDHHYVVAELELPSLQVLAPPPRNAKLYWKLNTLILQDEDFKENFNTFYKKVQADIENFADIADWSLLLNQQ